MMTTFRSFAATLLLALAGVGLSAHATTYSTDYTDLWWASPAASEDGWGVNIVQQNNILFVTMFVYGPDNTPRWYSGSNVVGTSQNTFTGDLYATTGTYLGSPWVQGQRTTQKVGTIAFTFNSNNLGAMSYNVNNVVVTKTIERITWAANVYTGNYIGGLVAFGSACGGNGQLLINGIVAVAHQNPTFTVTVDFVSQGANARCTYSGNYSQTGRLGAISNGNFSCVRGTQQLNQGQFTMTEMAATRNGFNARFAGTDQFCSYAGYFGGIKDVQ
jgi:hypothetical protein